MWLNVVFLLYALNMLAPSSKGLKVINISQSEYLDLENLGKEFDSGRRFATDEIPQNQQDLQGTLTDGKISDNNIASVASEAELLTNETRKSGHHFRAKDSDDEKDKPIKDKIYRLVEQTIEDTQRKMALTAEVKEHGKEHAPYKIGFILSMVKKSREVQNELFNVAVKHRDGWKSLEQMKIFELMVHTNVDTTNLVREMVEIHVQYANLSHIPFERKRVVMLRRSGKINTPAIAVFKDYEIKRNPDKLPLTGRRLQTIAKNATYSNDTLSSSQLTTLKNS